MLWCCLLIHHRVPSDFTTRDSNRAAGRHTHVPAQTILLNLQFLSKSRSTWRTRKNSPRGLYHDQNPSYRNPQSASRSGTRGSLLPRPTRHREGRSCQSLLATDSQRESAHLVAFSPSMGPWEYFCCRRVPSRGMLFHRLVGLTLVCTETATSRASVFFFLTARS